jgi:hypothetical protein
MRCGGGKLIYKKSTTLPAETPAIGLFKTITRKASIVDPRNWIRYDLVSRRTSNVASRTGMKYFLLDAHLRLVCAKFLLSLGFLINPVIGEG